jgi:AcrR family transcriptional regulator
VTNAKKSIIECAKRLINEEGYNNVSLRDIAESAGTTIGNLTYHFPKKEDLVFAIQEQIFADFPNECIDNGNPDDILRQLLESLKKICEDRDSNSFYYDNIILLSSEFEQFAKNINEIQHAVYMYLMSCFLKLRSYNLMRQDISEDIYMTLARTIIYVTFMWTQSVPIEYINKPGVSLHKAMIDMIYAFLTSDGIQLLSDIVDSAI